MYSKCDYKSSSSEQIVNSSSETSRKSFTLDYFTQPTRARDSWFGHQQKKIHVHISCESHLSSKTSWVFRLDRNSSSINSNNLHPPVTSRDVITLRVSKNFIDNFSWETIRLDNTAASLSLFIALTIVTNDKPFTFPTFDSTSFSREFSLEIFHYTRCHSCESIASNSDSRFFTACYSIREVKKQKKKVEESLYYFLAVFLVFHTLLCYWHQRSKIPSPI